MKFAFISHPLDHVDIARHIKLFKFLPGALAEGITRLLPVYMAEEIAVVRSPYAETGGWVIVCPLTFRQMLSLPADYVTGRIIEAVRLAVRLGAEIVGLGGITSTVDDRVSTITNNLGVAVTSGASFTAAIALEGTRQAAEFMGINLSRAEVAVLGIANSTGSVCARILARETGSMILVAKERNRLERVAHQILSDTGVVARLATDVRDALRNSDVVIATASAAASELEPACLKTGAVICDLAQPRNILQKLAQMRPDVLVIDGGVVGVPGDVQLRRNFGWPPKTACACMAETMIMALENRRQSFTRDLSVDQVREISALAQKHGFKLAGIRSITSPTELERIRFSAEKIRKQNLKAI